MKYPWKYVYHCHTSRCSHARGSDEEYVISAIKSGVKVLCFTDHTPIPGLEQKEIRMYLHELDEYIASINELKERYKDQIEIHLGLEVEYIPSNHKYLDEYREKGIEFFVLGEHGYYENNEFTWSCNESVGRENMINRYVNYVCEAMESGYVNYFCHPDMIINGAKEYDEVMNKGFNRIIKTAIKNNITLEINCQGIKNGGGKLGRYPDPQFWKMVSKYKGVKVTIGIDAHSPTALEDPTNVLRALEIAKEANIKLTKKLKPWIYK